MKQNNIKYFCLFVIFFFINITVGKTIEINTNTIDLNKFSGTWLEIARTPNFIQKNCDYSAVNYSLLKEKEILITNLCVTSLGSNQVRTFQASVIDRKKSSYNKINSTFYIEYIGIMSFFKPFSKGNFHIFYVNNNYTQAIVGSPNKASFWILSKDYLSSEKKQELLQIAKQYGLKTTNLLFNDFDLESKNKIYNLAKNYLN